MLIIYKPYMYTCIWHIVKSAMYVYRLKKKMMKRKFFEKVITQFLQQKKKLLYFDLM
jgi:hypothetical protein